MVLFSSTASRIVLDLDNACAGEEFVYPSPAGGKPYRLVLDIVETSHVNATPNGQISRDKVAPNVPSAREILLVPPGRKPDPMSAEKRVVVIDPGHGGVDPGAVTRNRILEKRVVLAAAKVNKKRWNKADSTKFF